MCSCMGNGIHAGLACIVKEYQTMTKVKQNGWFEYSSKTGPQPSNEKPSENVSLILGDLQYNGQFYTIYIDGKKVWARVEGDKGWEDQQCQCVYDEIERLGALQQTYSAVGNQSAYVKNALLRAFLLNKQETTLSYDDLSKRDLSNLKELKIFGIKIEEGFLDKHHSFIRLCWGPDDDVG